MKQNISFRIHYEESTVKAFRELEIEEIGFWIKAYLYTHPKAKAITAKVWTSDADRDTLSPGGDGNVNSSNRTNSAKNNALALAINLDCDHNNHYKNCTMD